MSLESIRLRATRGTQTAWTTGLKVYEKECVAANPIEIDLGWTTVHDTPQESFTVTVYWRGHYKGETIVSDWSVPLTVTFPASECAKSYDGSVWRWSHRLNFGGLKEAMTQNKTFNYADRSYDVIDLMVTVYANFTATYAKAHGNTYQSNRETQSLHIGYFPEFVIKNVRYEKSNAISIHYQTTWTRTDDRYCVEIFYDNNERRSILKKNVWGTITRGCANGRLGLIEFPTEYLENHVLGHDVHIRVRWNASYRANNMEFATADYRGPIEDATICNTPKLTLVPNAYGAKADQYVVNIKVTDTGDLKAPIDYATVKMRNGKYKVDEITVKAGEVAQFRFCPFNTNLIFDCVACRGTAVSRQVSIAASKIRHTKQSTVINSINDETFRAEFEYNQEFSVDTEAQKDIVKLAGRRRPSAFYGDGAAVSMSFDCDVVDTDAIDLESLPEFGDFIIRMADGRRYALAGTVSLNWSNPHYKHVTISGEEVDA